jgi:hypothetical protein
MEVELKPLKEKAIAPTPAPTTYKGYCTESILRKNHWLHSPVHLLPS